MKKPLVLCILDGCGLREESDGNAFKNAHKPTLDMLFNKYPHSILQASGPYVGLPEGQMGTSEVGHMNLGSGRIALQPLQAITEAINNREIFNNQEILAVLNHVKENNSNLHIMGLLSDGGIHSHINHLLALLDMCKENNVKNICVDVFTDGRDTYEKSALTYLDILDKKLKEVGGQITTINGRYYAMDRDNNFDRLKLAYDAICYGQGKEYATYQDLVNDSYANNKTDEFIIPAIIHNLPLNDNDGVIKKVLIPSPKVATYDLKPEMSVYEVTDHFLNEVGNYDVTIMNLANGDMVGHTGIYEAAVKAVEAMDECLAKIYAKTVTELGGTLMIIADHGNCDMMWDAEHKPVTSHTTNPVPCIVTREGITLNDGKLADVAPTMLELLNIPIPKEMTGLSLIKK